MGEYKKQRGTALDTGGTVSSVAVSAHWQHSRYFKKKKKKVFISVISMAFELFDMYKTSV